MKSFNSPLTCPDVVNFNRDISPQSATFQRQFPSSTRDFTHLARIPSHSLQIYLRHATVPQRARGEKPSTSPVFRLWKNICSFPTWVAGIHCGLSPRLSTSSDFRGRAAELESYMSTGWSHEPRLYFFL